MDRQTREAIEGSVRKWQKIVNCLKWKRYYTDELRRRIDDLEQGTGNCPLCKLFYHSSNYDRPYCAECPIVSKANDYGCQSTPYVEFWRTVLGKNLPEMKKAAKREVKFLKSLLE